MGIIDSSMRNHPMPDRAHAATHAMQQAKFPVLDNSADAVIGDGRVSFAYFDSRGRARNETKPLLSAAEVRSRIVARAHRFMRSSPAARESDKSRAERKYIAAQPLHVLHAAWALLDEMGKMEMSMMLDRDSHHGISEPAWLRSHPKPIASVLGDDEQPLN